MHRITEVDRAAWDALEKGTQRASHGWLRVLEETHRPAIEPTYFLAREAGELLGAAICLRARPEGPSFRLDQKLLGPLRGPAAALGLSFLPALICGLPMGTTRRLFVSKQLPAEERGRITLRLLGAIEEEARAAGLPVIFPDLVGGYEPELMRLLAERGYGRTFLTPRAFLDVEWSSFDGYLAALRARDRSYRWQAKRQIERAKQAGIEIRVLEDPALHRDVLHALAETHSQRLNSVPFAYGPEFFERVPAYLGTHARFLGAFQGGNLLGFQLVLRDPGLTECTLVGIDREQAGRSFAYFNLVYYRPIEDAIAEGSPRICFGRNLADVKARRGCRFHRLYLCHRSPHRLRSAATRSWLAFYERRALRKVPPGLEFADEAAA